MTWGLVEKFIVSNSGFPKNKVRGEYRLFTLSKKICGRVKQTRKTLFKNIAIGDETIVI